MPDILAPVRPTPPANEAVIGPNGDRHSQAWTQYHKSVSDWISAQNDKGVTDGSEAAAGDIGEFRSASRLTADSIALGNFTTINVTSLDLAPGDWDVWGNVIFAPAATTTINTIAAWISPASATPPGDAGEAGYTTIRAAFTTGQHQALVVGGVRVLGAGGSTMFLSVIAGFGVSTMVAYGTLNARRQR